ncbi:putative eka-like protein [Erysiphe necator]|uniref:Putative eka-like protein n=1 Tax=Uncinula necator TaxID=52586 RepID=A0A0B1P0X6_UNCNE|nr:putative eka-like protein [Erysiphe necator]
MLTCQYREHIQTHQGATANKNIKNKAVTQNSWTEIVRRKPAKNVVDLQTQEKVILPPIPLENTPKVISKPDLRLFLRMGQDYPWRRASPHYIKISLAEKLKVASSAITQVTRVNSGYVVTAVSEIMRNALLTQARRLEKSELKLEPASKWVSLLAPNVPDKLFSISGTVPTTAEMVIEETTLKTGIRPTSVRAIASTSESPTSNWILHFATGVPKLGEKLFGESGRLTEFQRKPRIGQCDRCHGHHPSKIYSKA